MSPFLSLNFRRALLLLGRRRRKDILSAFDLHYWKVALDVKGKMPQFKMANVSNLEELLQREKRTFKKKRIATLLDIFPKQLCEKKMYDFWVYMPFKLSSHGGKKDETKLVVSKKFRLTLYNLSLRLICQTTHFSGQEDTNLCKISVQSLERSQPDTETPPNGNLQ